MPSLQQGSLPVPRAPARRVPVSLKKSLRRVREALMTRSLHASDSLRITATDGAGDLGVVVFTSLHGGFAKEGHLEFAGTASAQGARPCVFVRDLRQAWYQDAADAAVIRDRVSRHFREAGISRLICVGDSMGAYGALVFAADLGAQAVLALGPQYDVSLEAMPLDPRWHGYRAGIASADLGAVDRWLRPGPEYFVLHGRKGADIVHWTRFPQMPNLHHFLIADMGHSVSGELKARGLLRDVFDAAALMRQDDLDVILAGIGGARRVPGETAATCPNDWYRDNILKGNTP